ncbi:MAG: response regulator transcription factor, partial [Acutalibacteraceae bacterium]
MSKLLLVEDDQSIVSSLSDYLGNEGFKIESASGQKEAIEKLDNDQYDIALVDIQLSNGNGFSVCSAIKERGTMPVIFLTASDDEYSVVAGLDMGADDYISKPFRPRELLSRINSVLRRTKNTQNIISYHDLVVDTNQATVVKNGTEILLSAMEYKLLLVFLRNKG